MNTNSSKKTCKTISLVKLCGKLFCNYMMLVLIEELICGPSLQMWQKRIESSARDVLKI
jgi:hypothetical protein